MTLPLPILEVQPRIQDIQQGRPYRITGIPIPDGQLTDPTYQLAISADDSYGSTTLFSAAQAPLPTFPLTGEQTSQLGTLLAAASPAAFANTGQTTSVGWYRIFAIGADPTTTETQYILVGHGPVLVRLNAQLTRADRILLGNGSCGCGASSSAGCGCASGCATCDHSPVPNPDDCNILTTRARVKGRWRGPYSDLTPPDNLGPYARYDVVEMPDARRFVYVGPADGVTPCQPPGT